MNVHNADWQDREGYLCCGYCSSLSCHELLSVINLNLIRNPGGSDWKYGYPHKFYLEIDSGIPAASFYKIILKDNEEPPDRYIKEYHKDFKYYYFSVDSIEEYRKYQPGHSASSGRVSGTGLIWSKFYTDHLKDIIDDDSIFTELTAKIQEIWGISFTKQDGIVSYSAPYHGYQR